MQNQQEKKFLISLKDETAYSWSKGVLNIKNIYYNKMYSFIDFTFKNKRKVVAGEIIAMQHVELAQAVGLYAGFNRYIYSPVSGWATIIDSEGILFKITPDESLESSIKIKSPYQIISNLQWSVELGEEVRENQVIGSIKLRKSKMNQEELIVAPFKGEINWLFQPNILNLNFGTLFSMNIEDEMLLKQKVRN